MNPTQQKSKHGLVIQLSSNNPAEQQMLIRQLVHLLDASGAIQVEVVVHGMAFNFLLQSSSMQAEKKQLYSKGVHFLLCQHTLNSNKEQEQGIFSFVDIVASGIAHIVNRQTEGWAYIKAGF